MPVMPVLRFHENPNSLFFSSAFITILIVVLNKTVNSSGLFTHLGPDCPFFLVLTGDINEDDDDADS